MMHTRNGHRPCGRARAGKPAGRTTLGDKALRELVLAMSMSLDGFVADPLGGIGWMFGGDEAAIAWKLETIGDASLHVMGSRTFHAMAAFWPTSATVFAPPMNRIPKAVFTSRPLPAPETARPAGTPGNAPAAAAGPRQEPPRPGAESWAEAQVASGDLADEVARLKAPGGRPIIAHGGAAFARSLVARGLVDRYALLVHPILLGQGLPIFSDLAAPGRLRLVDSRAFPKGSMAQVYRPA